MDDPAISAPDESPAPERSIGSRVLSWAGAVLALLIVLVLFMHVFAPPIGPDAESPPGHPDFSCIACHIVSASVVEERTP